MDNRRLRGSRLCSFTEPDGPLRDEVAGGGKEPIGSRRSFGPMDRPRSCSPSAARRRARHGFERQPDARRTRNERLERPLRMHLLSPLFVFNQFGDLEQCTLRPGNVHSADGWENTLKPVVARYKGKVSRIYFRADVGFANPDVYE